MKLKVLFVLFFVLLSGVYAAQDKKYIISGYVKDKKNGESLVGAVVSKKGTTQWLPDKRSGCPNTV